MNPFQVGQSSTKSAVTVSRIQKSATGQATWYLKNWSEFHEGHVALSSCLVTVGNSVQLRFFLRPSSKSCQVDNLLKSVHFYSLWVEVVSPEKELVFSVDTLLECVRRNENGEDVVDSVEKVTGLEISVPGAPKMVQSLEYDETIVFKRKDSGPPEVLVEEFFLLMHRQTIDMDSETTEDADDENSTIKIDLFPFKEAPDVKIKFVVSLFQHLEISTGGGDFKVGGGDEEDGGGEVGVFLREWDCGQFYDVMLRMNDGGLIPAHRVVLAAKSNVFRAMFSANAMEMGEAMVVISDIGTTAMKIILKFVYTGTLDSLWKDHVAAVINAATLYDLPELLKLCDNSLETICHCDNALELYKLAKLYKLERGMKRIEKFIQKNMPEVLNHLTSN